MVCMVSGVHFRGDGACCIYWCWVGKGWEVSTLICILGETLSGCVTHDPRVVPSEPCAIHPTHPGGVKTGELVPTSQSQDGVW